MTDTRSLPQKIEAWIRHGEAVPAGNTTYARDLVHLELRSLIQSADVSEQGIAATLSDEAMLAELIKRGRLVATVTPGPAIDA